MRSKAILPALPALLALLAGCSAATYEQDEKTISAGQGEEFTLSVPVDTARGENWYLGTPKPDPDVVRSAGDEEETDGGDGEGGHSGTHRFTFRAVGPGTVKIRLLRCPDGGCAGGGSEGGAVSPSPVPSGSPAPGADERGRYHTYTVTVTK